MQTNKKETAPSEVISTNCAADWCKNLHQKLPDQVNIHKIRYLLLFLKFLYSVFHNIKNDTKHV